MNDIQKIGSGRASSGLPQSGFSNACEMSMASSVFTPSSRVMFGTSSGDIKVAQQIDSQPRSNRNHPTGKFVS